MICFSCPNCSASVKAPSEYAGRRATCPTCKAKVQVPTAEQVPVALAGDPTTNDVIRQFSETPIDESIGPIVRSLATASILVATGNSPSDSPPADGSLQFLTGQDAEGRTWAYAYTTPDDLLLAFPQGMGYAELGFEDLFQIVDADAEFAGIVLNSASDSFYLMPRELFDMVREVLEPPIDLWPTQ